MNDEQQKWIMLVAREIGNKISSKIGRDAKITIDWPHNTLKVEVEKKKFIRCQRKTGWKRDLRACTVFNIKGKDMKLFLSAKSLEKGLSREIGKILSVALTSKGANFDNITMNNGGMITARKVF